MATKPETDDRPKKKKKKQKGSSAALWIGLGIGGVVLLLLIGGGVTLAVMRPWSRDDGKKVIAQNPPAKQDADKKEQPPPLKQGKLGGEVVREPKSLLGNIRRRPEETARNAEMVGLLRLYIIYCDEVKNSNARTLDSFLQSIRSEPGKVVMAVKDKTYLMNLKARLGSEEIVVYEAWPYTMGYWALRANNQFAYVSEQELKKAGLPAPPPPAE